MPDPHGVPQSRDLDYLAHLARDSARFVEVLARTPATTRVPPCPDWDADDLLWHLAEVQWFWGTVARRGLTKFEEVEALDSGGRPGDREGLLVFFGRASADLHHILSAASPDTPAWTWSHEQTLGFVRRRQAHEALIHRVDAELTAGDRTPMDPDLSTDGVDEALHVMYAGLPPWGGCFTPDPTRTIRVESTDTDGSWLVTLGRFTGTDPDGIAHDEPDLAVASWDRASDTGEPAAAMVRGAAADLDCWLWHRPPLGQVERGGDPLVLERLDQTIAEGIN